MPEHYPAFLALAYTLTSPLEPLLRMHALAFRFLRVALLQRVPSPPQEAVDQLADSSHFIDEWRCSQFLSLHDGAHSEPVRKLCNLWKKSLHGSSRKLTG